MLINVILDQFLNTKVSQGSVATRLRCDGIFNDQFITQSLLSPRVKDFWKSVNICRSYGQLNTGLLFFVKHSLDKRSGISSWGMDSANLGSIPVGTYISHWQRQEEHPAKVVPLRQ